MKQVLLSITFLALSQSLFAQGVGIGTTTPEGSAILDISSTGQGVLVPRMSSTNRQNILDPAKGLMVYDTTTKAFYYFTGNVWLELLAGSTDRIADADGDTKIQVEESADEDIIRLDLAGSERFVFQKDHIGMPGASTTAIGYNAGMNDDGSSNANVFIGKDAGRDNVAGTSNVAIGSDALPLSTSSFNTAVGWSALNKATTANNSTAFGSTALRDNIDGSNNIAVGSQALVSNDHGSENVAIGSQAGQLNAGSGNIFLGHNAGKNEAGSNKLYIDNNATTTPLIYGDFGTNLFRVNGTLNINNAFSLPLSDGATGQVLKTNGAGLLTWDNETPAVMQDSDADTKIQVEANPDEDIVRIDLAGTEHFQLHPGRIEILQSGKSTYIGESAGMNDDLSDNYNTALGFQAMMSNITGDYNSAFGEVSLQANTSGHANSAFGSESLYSNTTGYGNTGVGLAAGYATTDGYENTALGNIALSENTTGYKNTAIGVQTLFGNVTGARNTALGYHADVSDPELINATAIGAEAVVSQSNSLVLGNNANVGIGTSAPQQKLHVVGNTYLEDGLLNVDGSVLVRDTGGIEEIDSSAALQIGGTTRGFLMPRLTTAEMNAITSPAHGLQIFNTDDGCTYLFARGSWMSQCGFGPVDSVFLMQEHGVGAWFERAPFLGGERDGASGFTIGSKGYMGLGESQSGDTQDIYEYDPATDSWTQMADLPAAARCMAVAVVIDSVAYIGLGEGGGTYFQDFYKFNPYTNSWNAIANFPGPGRIRATGFALGGKMYVGLGRNNSSVFKTFYVYDPDLDTWTQLPDFPGLKRSSAVCTVSGDTAYVGTGISTNAFSTSFYLKDWWRFNPVDTSWEQRADYPGVPIAEAVAYSLQDHIYVASGWVSIGPTPNFWMYDPDANTWFRRANTGGPPRLLASGFVVDDQIYLGTGGTSADGSLLLEDFWTYKADAGNFSGSITTEGTSAWVQETWRQEGNNIFTALDGNVGIGPGDPDEKLHVENGNIMIELGDLIMRGQQKDSAGVITQISMQNYDGHQPQIKQGPRIISRRTEDDGSDGYGFQNFELRMGAFDQLVLLVNESFIPPRMGIHTSEPVTEFDVDSKFKLGDDGTAMDYFIKATVSHNVPSIPAGSSTSQVLTVTGVTIGSSVMISPANALPAGVIIAYARVSADDSVEITFFNASGTAADPANMNYYMTVAK